MTFYILSTHLYYYYRMFSIPLKCPLYLLYTSREVFIWRINYCQCVALYCHYCHYIFNNKKTSTSCQLDVCINGKLCLQFKRPVGVTAGSHAALPPVNPCLTRHCVHLKARRKQYRMLYTISEMSKTLHIVD